MNRDKTPCIDCADRKVGCHASCQAYKDWKEQHEAERMQIREQRNKRSEFADYKKSCYGKMTRRGYELYRERRNKGIRRVDDVERGEPSHE